MYDKLPWYNEQLYSKAEITYAPIKGFLEGSFSKYHIFWGKEDFKNF